MYKEARKQLLQSKEYIANLDYLFPHLENMHRMASVRNGDNVQVCVTGASGAYGTELVDAMMRFNQRMMREGRHERFQVIGQTSNVESQSNERIDNAVYKTYYTPVAKDIRNGLANEHLNYAYVINFASNAEPHKYVADPQGTYDIVRKGVKNIIDYANIHPSSRVIQISSVEACGKISGQDGLQIFEDTYGPMDETNTYGLAKREAEIDILNTKDSNAQVLVARFPRSFSLCDNEDRKIFGPAMITDAAKGRTLLQKSEGQIRDTSDSTTVLAQMITIAAKGNAGEIYNMSNPHLVAPMSDFTRTCAKVGGVECQIGTGGDLGRNTATETGCVLSPSKFMKQFPDFRCRYDNLEDAIRDTMIVKCQAYDIQNKKLELEREVTSMSSKVVKMAQRTEAFIDAFYKDGAGAHLGPVDITQAPWHSGYQNQSLQKHHTAIVGNEELKKGGILEGCGTWEYKIPDAANSRTDLPFKLGNSFTVVQVDDKRRIPRAYRDSAEYTVSIDKMKEKFGDNFANVYYNLQDKAVIMSQPEGVRKKAFDRFLLSQLKEVQKQFSKEPVEWVEGLTAALTAQYVDDYKTGEWLKYAEDVIGQFPGGIALEEKKKEHMKANNEAKKEKAGLTDKSIEMAFGGSSKSPFEPNAGVFVVEFPMQNGQTDIGNALRANVDDIIDYAENLMGTPDDKYGQKLFVSKDIVDETTGKSKVALLFRGLHSENEGEVEAALKRACRDCIEDNTPLRENIDFTFSEISPALSSQVKNAVERYTVETGTWMSPKSLRKPLVVEDVQTLNEQLLSTNTPETDMQMQ